MFCPHCGGVNNSSSSLCVHCGQSVLPLATPTVVAPWPPPMESTWAPPPNQEFDEGSPSTPSWPSTPPASFETPVPAESPWPLRVSVFIGLLFLLAVGVKILNFSRLLHGLALVAPVAVVFALYAG